MPWTNSSVVLREDVASALAEANSLRLAVAEARKENRDTLDYDGKKVVLSKTIDADAFEVSPPPNVIQQLSNQVNNVFENDDVSMRIVVKQEFLPGETVSAKLVVIVKRDLPVVRIVARLVGFEEAWWMDQGPDGMPFQRTTTTSFLDESAVVFCVTRGDGATPQELLPAGTWEWPVTFESRLPEGYPSLFCKVRDHSVFIRYGVGLELQQPDGQIGFIPLPRLSRIRQDFAVRPAPAAPSRLAPCVAPLRRSADVPVVILCCVPQGDVRGWARLERQLFNLKDGDLTGLLTLSAKNESQRDIRRVTHSVVLHMDTFQDGFFGGGFQSVARLARCEVPGSFLRPGQSLECSCVVSVPAAALEAPSNYLSSIPGRLTRLWFEVVVDFEVDGAFAVDPSVGFDVAVVHGVTLS